MKHRKMMAIALTALLCVSAIPFLVSDDGVSGDPVTKLELSEGKAWGFAYEGNSDELIPPLEEFLKKTGTIAEDSDFNAYVASAVGGLFLYAPMVDVPIGMEISDFGFDAKIALLIEVVEELKDENGVTTGYVIEFSIGIGLAASLDGTLNGTFLKEGTYDESVYDPNNGFVFEDSDYEAEAKDVPVSMDLFLKLNLFAVGEFDTKGALMNLALELDLKADLDLNIGINYIVGEDEGGNTEYVFKYESTSYNVHADINAAAEVAFSDDGLMIIPFDLNDTDYPLPTDDSTEPTLLTTTIEIVDLSIEGSITASDNFMGFLDLLLDGGLAFMMGSGVIDLSDLNNITIFGIKLNEDGELKLNDLLGVVDLNALLDALSASEIEYYFAMAGDDINGYTTYMGDEYSWNGGTPYLDGFVLFEVENFLWYGNVGNSIFLMIMGIDPDNPPEGFMDAFDKIIKGTTPMELDDDGKRRVKDTLNNISSFGSDDDGGNKWLDIAIVLAIILVIVLFSYFAFIRPRMKNKA